MKSVMISIVTLVVASVVVFESCEAVPGVMSGEDMYNCYYVIVCNVRKPEEFRRLIKAAGPVLLEKSMQWFRDISRMPDAEDTDEFWAGYPDRKCAYDEDTKRDMFNEWLMKIGEYWSEVCEHGPQDECTKMEDAARELTQIMTEYTLSGDCNNANKAKEAMDGAMPDGGMKLPGKPNFGNY